LKIPTQAEKKERKLQELITKSEKMPVALFIDEAHDLHRNTLIV
jgi:type II secretory pathway predicted ATPase ExeA